MNEQEEINASKRKRTAAAAKARAAAAAALECKNEKMEPSCTKCLDTPPLRAVILFPNLGTPLILPPDEKKLTFFIAAEDKALGLFGFKGGPRTFPRPCPLGYMYVDKHLRIYPINAKGLSEDTKTGRLWDDGMTCDEAYKHVKVWNLGFLHDSDHLGRITDKDGKIVANIRASTLAQFNATVPAFKDPDPLVINEPLKWIFQIEIDLAGLPAGKKPVLGKIVSLAWMMEMPQCYKKAIELVGMTDWEYQDKLIYDFLHAQKHNKTQNHVPQIYEFDVKTARSGVLPKLKSGVVRRLKAWHPVSIGPKRSLKIGHLTDVHVNSRQFAMATSIAQVLPGESARLGSKVDNCFIALLELFENMKEAGADVIFLTGDLLDFNRNLDPRKVRGVTPGSHYKIYDLVKNVGNASLYPRGIDDMLIFSLIRYSYEILGLPLFITTGNHEAYDVPYGISPRLNPYVAARALDQRISDHTVVMPARLRRIPLPLTLNAARTGIEKGSDALGRLPGIGPAYKPLPGKIHRKSSEILTNQTDPNSYDLIPMKMNDGIPADHNLTIYEACMVYGPSFPQVVKPFNFMPANFDWFFTLFTPLADYRIDYKDQVLLGLDWGESEIMVNLDMTPEELASTVKNDGEGIKGTFSEVMGGVIGLPRADKSLNEMQKAIIEDVIASKKRVMLFTHFTLINYDMQHPLGRLSTRFAANDQRYNGFTKGTFSVGRDWLYPKLNRGIHFTLAGHSHRSGIYHLDNASSLSMQAQGFQPAEMRHKVEKGTTAQVSDTQPAEMHGRLFKNSNTTRIGVTSCSGPIGVQNIKGELHGWNLMPPSGTLIDIDANGPLEFQRVVTQKYRAAQPRFCVALDTIQTNGGLQVAGWSKSPPERFPTFADPNSRSLYHFYMDNVIEFTDFVERLTFKVWDDKKLAFSEFKTSLTVRKDVRKCLVYKMIVADHDGFFALAPKTKADKAPMVFACIKFNMSLATNPIYQHYNFTDDWIHRVDVVKDPKTGLVEILKAEKMTGEVPDWEWLYRADPKKYPMPPKSKG